MKPGCKHVLPFTEPPTDSGKARSTDTILEMKLEMVFGTKWTSAHRVMGTEGVTAMPDRLPRSSQRPRQAWFIQECKSDRAPLLCTSLSAGGDTAHGEFLQADSSKHTCLQQQTTLAPLSHWLQQPISFSVLIFKKIKNKESYFFSNRHQTEVCLSGIQSRILQNILFCFPDLSCINVCFTNMSKTLILHSTEFPLNYSTEGPPTHGR